MTLASAIPVPEEQKFPALLIFALSILSILSVSSMTLILPAIPSIKQNFDVDLATVQMIVSSGFVIMGVGQFAFGVLGDRYNRQQLLILATAGFALGSVLAGLAPTIEFVILGRALQAGFGSAGITLSRAVVMDNVSSGQAGRVLSLIILPVTLAPVCAPVVGGLVTDTLGWRWTFHLSAVLAVLFMPVLFIKFPEQTVLLGRERLKILRSLGSVLSSRSYRAYTGIHSLMIIAVNVMHAASPIILISQMGLSPTIFGAYATLPAFGAAAGAAISSRLSMRLDGDTLVYASLILSGLGYGAILWAEIAGVLSPFAIYIPLTLITLSVTLGMPAVSTGALEHQRDNRASAAGLMGLLQWFGAGLGVQLTAHWLSNSILIVILFSMCCVVMAAHWMRFRHSLE